MPKLLFDQNLSHRILTDLGPHFVGSTHVRIEGLQRADDRRIWEFARRGEYIIVTKDSDFNDLTLLYGIPPKILWIRVGNCRSGDIVALIKSHERQILDFASERSTAILELK
jgi:predicted nuclease of predicted toxin-antitoxin system